jgi:hypothetical protein
MDIAVHFHQHLESTFLILSVACAIVAVVSMIAAAFWPTDPAKKQIAQDAVDTAKQLALTANNAHKTAQMALTADPASARALGPIPIPSADDIAKVMSAAKDLIDSLSKASPMVAWLAASVFFAMIAVFGDSGFAQSTPPLPSCSDKPAPCVQQPAKPAPPPPLPWCSDKAQPPCVQPKPATPPKPTTPPPH